MQGQITIPVRPNLRVLDGDVLAEELLQGVAALPSYNQGTDAAPVRDDGLLDLSCCGMDGLYVALRPVYTVVDVAASEWAAFVGVLKAQWSGEFVPVSKILADPGEYAFKPNAERRGSRGFVKQGGVRVAREQLRATFGGGGARNASEFFGL